MSRSSLVTHQLLVLHISVAVTTPLAVESLAAVDATRRVRISQARSWVSTAHPWRPLQTRSHSSGKSRNPSSIASIRSRKMRRSSNRCTPTTPISHCSVRFPRSCPGIWLKHVSQPTCVAGLGTATQRSYVSPKRSSIPAYVNLQASTERAYFKSTDGHTNNWRFNLRRPNLHIIPLIAKHAGWVFHPPYHSTRFIPRSRLVLVDSTRAGKRIPDALSKTVPMWCSVVNRAILKRTAQTDLEAWDTALYTPPGNVSPQEHSQIEDKLDGWASQLAVKFSLQCRACSRTFNPSSP